MIELNIALIVRAKRIELIRDLLRDELDENLTIEKQIHDKWKLIEHIMTQEVKIKE